MRPMTISEKMALQQQDQLVSKHARVAVTNAHLILLSLPEVKEGQLDKIVVTSPAVQMIMEVVEIEATEVAVEEVMAAVEIVVAVAEEAVALQGTNI